MLASRQAVAQRPVAARRPVCSRRRHQQVRCGATFDTSTSGIIVRRGITLDGAKAEGFTRWPTWSCGVSKFPWTYDESETCYLLQGKVVVTPEGAEEGVEIGPGDLVTFQEGLSCTWDVKEPVKKHYQFG